MQYQFSGGELGECRVDMRTAGRHGFASPKMFRITCLEDTSADVVTFRFTDKVVNGLNGHRCSEFSNATLCRIAIAQYLRSTPQALAGATLDLDTAIPAFDGPVLNARGVVLTVARLHSPRGMARTCDCTAARNRHGAARDTFSITTPPKPHPA